MHQFGSAWWTGIATGTILTSLVIAPRLATIIILLLLIIAGIEHVMRRSPARQPAANEKAFLVVIVFAGWAILTALWSPMPWHSLLKPIFMILVAVAVWLALRTISTASRPFAHYFGEGALVGTIVSYILVCFEILTEQHITRVIMSELPITHVNISKHVTVDAQGTVTGVTIANLNRRIAILSWLCWPAIMLALHDPSMVRRWIALITVIGGAGVILLFGSHQSSQVAIVGGSLVYGLAWFNLNMVRITVSCIWAIVVLFAVPLSLMLFYSDIHKADWLFRSARHRVVIWATTADQVYHTPILGVGADATREAMRRATSTPQRRQDFGEFKSGFANHAHNAYLQVWYELGAIGAALFLVIGLSAMRVISRLNKAIQPAAIAMFVTTSLLIAFSYSIWQTWFIAVIGFSVIIFAVACRKRSDQIAPPGTFDDPDIS